MLCVESAILNGDRIEQISLPSGLERFVFFIIAVIHERTPGKMTKISNNRNSVKANK